MLSVSLAVTLLLYLGLPRPELSADEKELEGGDCLRTIGTPREGALHME